MRKVALDRIISRSSCRYSFSSFIRSMYASMMHSEGKLRSSFRGGFTLTGISSLVASSVLMACRSLLASALLGLIYLNSSLQASRVGQFLYVMFSFMR